MSILKVGSGVACFHTREYLLRRAEELPWDAGRSRHCPHRRDVCYNGRGLDREVTTSSSSGAAVCNGFGPMLGRWRST